MSWKIWLAFRIHFSDGSILTLMSACVHKERESHLGSVHGTMIATTHAMWEHSVNVPLENNLFRLGEHDGMPDAALFASSKVYLLFLSNNTLFYFDFSFCFIFSFYSPRDACTSALVAPDAFVGSPVDQHKYNRVNSIHYAFSRIWSSMPVIEARTLPVTRNKEVQCTI